MGLKKQYLKSRSTCKVTFRLPKEAAKTVKKVNIVGEFNNWSKEATPMKRLKNGAFVATMELDPDREYEYRYLLDDEKWENDWQADKYVPTPFGNGDNSVVVV